MAKFHLLYHIYPRPTPLLLLNLERIIGMRQLFDGKMLFSVVQGELPLISLDQIETYLRRRLADHRPEQLEFFRVPNSSSEANAFFDTLLPHVAAEKDAFTFFGHTKGTGSERCENPCVLLWTHWLYEHNLLARERLLEILPRYAAAGCFRMRRHPPGQQQAAWHFSGTFFWLNHARVFGRDWQPRNRERFAAEGWLGSFLPLEETCCLFGEGQGNLYARRAVAKVLPDAKERQRQLDGLGKELNLSGDLLRTLLAC
jgi:hypothetical protein